MQKQKNLIQMNRERHLTWIIYCSGIICAFIFLSVRISPKMMNTILKTKTYAEFEDFTKYGELYMFSMVNDFKEDLPQAKEKYRLSSKQPRLDEADVLFFGDSQFDHSRHKNVPERLNDSLDKKVFYHRYIDPHWAFILSYLEANKYTNDDKKLVVFESTERYIYNRFISDPDVLLSDTRSEKRKMIATIRGRLFNPEAEFLYTILLKRSYITSDIYSLIATIKFRLFGLISSMTPKYTLGDSPWIFYKENIDHFYTDYSDEDISKICDNIKKLAILVKERYNLDFIFVPLPEKYTLYHNKVNNDKESDFLQRVYNGLEQRQVPYVQVLDTLKKSDELVYPRTDTHLNEKGSMITFEKLMDVIKKDTTLNYLFNHSNN